MDGVQCTCAIQSDIIIPAGATVALCLNGTSLDLGHHRIEVKSGAQLTVCDCVGGGIIRGFGGEDTTDGWENFAAVVNRGTFILQGGTVECAYAGSGNSFVLPLALLGASILSLTMTIIVWCRRSGGSRKNARRTDDVTC